MGTDSGDADNLAGSADETGGAPRSVRDTAAPAAEAGPGGRDELRTERRTVFAMGTVFSFVLVVSASGAGDLQLERAEALLHQLDRLLTTYDPSSPMSRVREGSLALVDAPHEIAEVLQACARARRISRGWFDPWSMPGGCDPTGLVKGWAVEAVLRLFDVPGVGGVLVNGGGDIACRGEPAPGERWRVGLRHPWRADAFAGVVTLDHAIATSGTYERPGQLIHPGTGAATAAAVQASVTGPDLALADALATALAVAGDDLLPDVAALDGYEAHLIRPDGTETATPGFPFTSAGLVDGADSPDGSDTLLPGREARS